MGFLFFELRILFFFMSASESKPVTIRSYLNIFWNVSVEVRWRPGTESFQTTSALMSPFQHSAAKMQIRCNQWWLVTLTADQALFIGALQVLLMDSSSFDIEIVKRLPNLFRLFSLKRPSLRKSIALQQLLS